MKRHIKLFEDFSQKQELWAIMSHPYKSLCGLYDTREEAIAAKQKIDDVVKADPYINNLLDKHRFTIQLVSPGSPDADSMLFQYLINWDELVWHIKHHLPGQKTIDIFRKLISCGADPSAAFPSKKELNDWLRYLEPTKDPGKARAGNTINANLYELGSAYLEKMGTDPGSRDQCTKAGRQLLSEAQPFPLSGNGKKDIAKVIEFIAASEARNKIQLDLEKIEVSSDNFTNEVRIPIIGAEDLAVETMVDYMELLYGGEGGIVIGMNYTVDGSSEVSVLNIGDQEEFDAAATEFKGMYMKKKKGTS